MRRISQFVMALVVIGTGAALPAAPARAQSAAEIFHFCLQNPRNSTCQQIERNGGRVVAQPRRDDRRRGDEYRRDDRRGYDNRRDDRRSYDRRDDRRRYDRDDRYDRRDDRRWDDDGWDN